MQACANYVGIHFISGPGISKLSSICGWRQTSLLISSWNRSTQSMSHRQVSNSPVSEHTSDTFTFSQRRSLNAMYASPLAHSCSFVVTWKRGGKIQIEWTSWTSQCCDLLDQYAEANGDHVLATMARISGILWQASRAMSPDGGQSCAETRQTLNGLAAQVQQLRATTPDYISSHGMIDPPPRETRTNFIQYK